MHKLQKKVTTDGLRALSIHSETRVHSLGTLGLGGLAGGAECAPLCSGTTAGDHCAKWLGTGMAWHGTGTRTSRVRPVMMIFSGAEPPIFSNFWCHFAPVNPGGTELN